MEALEKAYDILFLIILFILAVLILFVFFRAAKGPKATDRIICINMIGTLVIIIIVILSAKFKEAWLIDIAILYAMISFLAVVVLSKIYLGAYREEKAKKEKEEESKEQERLGRK